MILVRVSDEAIRNGPAQIERELVQLGVLRALPGGEQLVLASSHSEEILWLAKWRELPIGEQGEGGVPVPIADLWENRLRVTVVVACHNYGHFLDEAVSSVLAQSYLPDEIFLSDDGSSDESPSIMRKYAEKFPETIRLNLNETNMGIQAHFNHVLARVTGDLVVIIGADNRAPSNYIESQFTALALDEEVGLAYTDFALFGGRAKRDYERLRPDFRGQKLPSGVFLSQFPEFSTESAELLGQGHNFIHGSTMYRKSAFDQVGGYINRDEGPEDMTLFQAILATGLSAKKVFGTALEYRQHSVEQANYQFEYFGELQRLKEETRALTEERKTLHAELDECKSKLVAVRTSTSFRLGRAIITPVSRLLRFLRLR